MIECLVDERIMSKKCVCVCVGEGWRGLRGVCPHRRCEIFLKVSTYLNYGLCPVHLFYECDRLDVLFIYISFF